MASDARGLDRLTSMNEFDDIDLIESGTGPADDGVAGSPPSPGIGVEDARAPPADGPGSSPSTSSIVSNAARLASGSGSGAGAGVGSATAAGDAAAAASGGTVLPSSPRGPTDCVWCPGSLCVCEWSCSFRHAWPW